MASETPNVTIPLADYERLLEAAQGDDMIVWCETCGAWLDRNDTACAAVEDFTGCLKSATHDARFDSECRSYRAIVREEANLKHATASSPAQQGDADV